MDRTEEDRVPSLSLTSSDSSDNDREHVDDPGHEHPSTVAQETHGDKDKEHSVTPDHHEERPVDPSVVFKRKRVESGGHGHTSLNDRVAKVEAKVDAVRSNLDEVKS